MSKLDQIRALREARLREDNSRPASSDPPSCPDCARKDAEIAALREAMQRMADKAINPPAQMIAPDAEIARLQAILDGRKAAKAAAMRKWRQKRKEGTK